VKNYVDKMPECFVAKNIACGVGGERLRTGEDARIAG
jgi:hypothetical protein